MEAAHTLLLQYYYSYVAAKKGAAKFIRDSVNETYYKDLEHATTFYKSVTAEELLLHLQTNCGGDQSYGLVVEPVLNGAEDQGLKLRLLL